MQKNPVNNEDLRETLRSRDVNKKRRKTNKKTIIAIMAIIAIIITVIVIININKFAKIENIEISQYDYFIISSNEKSGVIDKNGNIVISPEYDYIQIPNPSEPIFICLYEYNTSTKEYNSKVLNEKGEEILNKYKNIQAIPNNNTSIKNSYNTGILTYKENDKYGIITIKGKKITSAIYDSIETLEYKDGILRISQDGKYGLIKLNGEEVIKPEYNLITTDGFYSQDTNYEKAGYIVNIKTEEGYRYGYIDCNGKQILDTMYTNLKRITEIKDVSSIYLVTYKNGKTGLMKNGRTIYDTEYEDIDYDSTNQIVMLQKNAKQGIYDLSGNMILPIQYDNITFAGQYINAIRDGELQVFDLTGTLLNQDSYKSLTKVASGKYSIVIDRNGNYGVLSSNNTLLIQNRYSYIEYAFDEYFIVSQQGKSGIIDSKENTVIEINKDVIQNIKGSNIIQIIDSETNTSQLYNKSMQKILEEKELRIYIKDNYVQAVSENNITYIDFEGNVKKSEEIFSQKEIFAKKQNGKWGYVDKTGNVIIDYIYDMAIDINEYGYGAIKQNGKWGSINAKGEIVKQPTYELTSYNPNFIGEYYEVSDVYQISYFSNEIREEE